MCANFVGDKCVFQYSMTDIVPNDFALVYLFSAQTFFTGAASLLGMLGQGSLTLVVGVVLLLL